MAVTPSARARFSTESSIPRVIRWSDPATNSRSRCAALSASSCSSGKLMSASCATALLALWSILLRRRAGAAAALAITFLFAANPVFVRYAYSATTDVPDHPIPPQ